MARFLLLFGIVLIALTIASNTKKENKNNKKVVTFIETQTNPVIASNIDFSIKELQAN
ncbi:hypothetical protein [Flavobacterium sp. Arc2]|jgi:hypothetical protein|uniref:hypothetical protein n=1 Tax=Flavobacterium sp. Arc2 TaxID=3046685 RepID=UPI00352BEA55